jgi:hypothetical protein
VAWLAPLGDGAGSLLCQRHAEGFAVPRGWWLNDRRQDATLFTAQSAAEPVEKSAPARTRRRRRPVVAAAPAAEPLDESLPLDAETPAVVVVPVVEPVVVEHGWAQRAASMGDLDGLLDARTPLLARAFRQPGTAGERPPHAAGDAAS